MTRKYFMDISVLSNFGRYEFTKATPEVIEEFKDGVISVISDPRVAGLMSYRLGIRVEVGCQRGIMDPGDMALVFQPIDRDFEASSTEEADAVEFRLGLLKRVA